jgi:putative phage-type endonuclease
MEIIQGTPEWKQLRAGKATASRIADIIAKTKSGYSTSRENYLTELVIERFGVINDGFTNAAMQWGTETEPLARAQYELESGALVEQVAFVDHPTIEMSGASPDGLIGSDGLLEIKCPNPATHFNYLLENKVPEKYKAQMAWQLACTGRKWADFVSFDPRVPEGLQYFQIRFVPEPGYIEMLESEVIVFLKEVEARYLDLKEIMDKRAA